MIYKYIRGSDFINSSNWCEAKSKLVRKDVIMVIFISHRWETPYSSDPKLNKFKAIKRLLISIESAIKCYFAIKDNKHLNYIDSLERYGVIHYIILASRFIYLSQKEIFFEEVLKNPLKYIGIWYDEACLDIDNF